MSSITYQDDFIVGGSANSRITPNFTLKEFRGRNGKVHVYRELVAALQILRDKLAEPISIKRLDASGLGAVISSEAADELLALAKGMKRDRYFAKVTATGQAIHLETPPPGTASSIEPELAFDCGMQVTAAYETSGDPYQQVTGNFDGAGLSFGPIQCNLKTGTLQDLFRRFRGEDEARLKRCFADDEVDYRAFWKILDGSRRGAVRWADERSTGRSKAGFQQPWKGYLQAIGREEAFRGVMMRYAYDKYGKVLLSTLSFLRGISPVHIRDLRCLTALYDMGVQQGGYAKARAEIISRVFSEQPTDEFSLTRIVVEERAKKANVKYRADCLSRRLGILERRPVKVSLNGTTSTRKNPRYYLLRNSSVKEIDHYLGEENSQVG